MIAESWITENGEPNGQVTARGSGHARDIAVAKVHVGLHTGLRGPAAARARRHRW
jgi:hypothetical protein